MITFLLFSTLVLTAFTRADFIPMDAVCSTLFTSLTCVCKSREDVQLTPIFDEEISQISVKGCGTVIVTFGVFTSLKIEDLEFGDIDNLTFTQFSLSAIRGMMSLKLENIALLSIQQHAFIHFSYVDFIHFSNVTVDKLPREAFSQVFNVKYLLIENSNFKIVEQMAFDVQNVTIIRVVDSQFDSLVNDSISIHQAEEVGFENCTFLAVEDSAFWIHTVSSISFHGCTFGTLGTTFIKTTDVEELNISSSVMGTIKTDAFASVDDGKIIFENNTIQIAYPNSLTPFFTQKDSDVIEYCCNYYECDCNMYWIWEYEDSLNPSVLKNSKCSLDQTKDLSMYTPVLDSYNNCLTLKLTSESDTTDNNPIISKLPVQFRTSEAPIVSLNTGLSFILCCLIITELLRKIY